jgi:Uma2 family endonuclease
VANNTTVLARRVSPDGLACYDDHMSALAKIPGRMTVAEFFAWTPPTDQLWQLVDGEPQAIATANRTHGAIQSELAALIRNHLADRESPCTVITTPRVIPHVQSQTNVRVPDLAVTCSGYDEEEQALADPVVLIEILSPNNQAETYANVWAYTTIPSVKEILVLKAAVTGAELLRRSPDGTWPKTPLIIEAGNLTLESIGFSMPLAAAYRTTRLAHKK